LEARATCIAQKVTSVALKFSVSEEFLDDLEKTIDKLDFDANNSLSQNLPNLMRFLKVSMTMMERYYKEKYQ
jgi:hypothetical protein